MIIGIYDSGLGGLSVWQQLQGRVGAQLIYFGDTAHLPYGDKSPEQLENYFRASLAFFASRGCHHVVVACNTTSTVVLPRIQQVLQVPVIGMIEGAVSAVAAAGGKRIGILATQATAQSGVYQKALEAALPKSEVYVQGAPELVPLVEEGQVRGPRVKQVLSKYLKPLQAKGIDSLLLGCTHYSFLAEPIEELLGQTIQVIDPAPAVAHRVEELWEPRGQNSATEFWVSAEPERFRATAELILGQPLPPVSLQREGEGSDARKG